MQDCRAFDGCCTEAPESKPGQSAIAEPIDATLSSCCRRDALEQRRVARAKEALLGVDRVDLRTRLHNGVLKRPSSTHSDTASDIDSLVSDEEGAVQDWSQVAP